MEYFSELGYFGLLGASFLAATILPLSSEVVLSILLLNDYSPAPLVLTATAGNVSGSLVNYALGYWASQELIKRWLKMTETDFVKAKQRFNRYGLLSLCFAWIPIVGDPLTIVAGILRIPLFWFVILVGTGKLLRYIGVSYLTLQAI